MDEQLAMALAMAEEPENSALRLMAADWYEDHGDQGRGEFIRACVDGKATIEELARCLVACRERWSAIPEADMVYLNGHRILGKEGPAEKPIATEWWVNGFIAAVQCGMGTWMARGDALCRVHPIQRVWTYLKPYQSQVPGSWYYHRLDVNWLVPVAWRIVSEGSRTEEEAEGRLSQALLTDVRFRLRDRALNLVS